MMSRLFHNCTYSFIFWSVLSSLVYAYFSHVVIRHEHLKLGLCIGLLFVAYYFILKIPVKTSFLLGVGLLFRLIFLFSIPNLSQDFYRFIWDGRVLLSGLNPYLFSPTEVLDTSHGLFAHMQDLYHGMGALSTQHFSNYPPFHQIPFVLAAMISGKSIMGSVVLFRILMILADVGIVIFGKKLLSTLALPTKNIFYYFLNPLVIIELTGNLHFEGLMLLFLVLSLYFFYQNNIIRSAVYMSFSVLTKLLPLLLLPIVIYQLKPKKILRYVLLIAVLLAVFFMPFFEHEFLKNYGKTLGLWFTNFEFNSSIYTVMKRWAAHFLGLKLINYMPYIVPFLMTLILMYFLQKKSIGKNSILVKSLWVLTFYFLIASTVHPWYICSLVLLCCFTKYRFAVVWSGTVFLSYFAYHQNHVSDNIIGEVLEYSIFGGYLLYELIVQQRAKASSIS